jgi:hypothetical protein
MQRLETFYPLTRTMMLRDKIRLNFIYLLRTAAYRGNSKVLMVHYIYTNKYSDYEHGSKIVTLALGEMLAH